MARSPRNGLFAGGELRGERATYTHADNQVAEVFTQSGPRRATQNIQPGFFSSAAKRVLRFELLRYGLAADLIQVMLVFYAPHQNSRHPRSRQHIARP